jgi:hypothetical protein
MKTITLFSDGRPYEVATYTLMTGFYRIEKRGCRHADRNQAGTSSTRQEGSYYPRRLARHPYWKYDRSMVKGGALAIKEWDYYAVINPTTRICGDGHHHDLGMQHSSLSAISTSMPPRSAKRMHWRSFPGVR